MVMHTLSDIHETLELGRMDEAVHMLYQLSSDQAKCGFTYFMAIQKAIATLYPRNSKPWPYPREQSFGGDTWTVLMNHSANIELLKEFLVYYCNNHGLTLDNLSELYDGDRKDLLIFSLQHLAQTKLLNHETIRFCFKLSLHNYDLETIKSLEQLLPSYVSHISDDELKKIALLKKLHPSDVFKLNSTMLQLTGEPDGRLGFEQSDQVILLEF